MPGLRSLALDVVSGSVSSAASILAGLAAAPIYLSALGREGYGVIGFIATLHATLLALDGGIALSITRELAPSSEVPGETARLLLGLKRLTFRVAIAVAVAVALMAPPLASGWLNPAQLASGFVAQCIAIAGISAAAKWIGAIYQAVLTGRGRLAAVNAVNTVFTVGSTVGAIAIVGALAADLRWMLAWLAFASCVQTSVLHSLAREAWHGAERPAPIGSFLRRSLPAAGIGVVGLASMQVDKLVVSAAVALDEFGVYSIAALAAGALYVIVTPFFNAIYPRLAAVSGGSSPARAEVPYRDASLALGAFVLPVACALAFFARPVLLLWTRDEATTEGAAPLLTLLSLGTGLHAIMYVPYALKLACGASRLALAISCASLAVCLPLTMVLALAYGATGAAAAWLLSNLLYLIAGSVVTHRRLLPGLGWSWLLEDVAPAAALSVVATAGAAAVARACGWPAIPSAVLAMLSVMMCWAICAAVSPRLRAAARQLISIRARSPR